MTDFFPFEQLTWPEVEELPRHLPLVIPLGEGYALDRLASALGNPARVGLLPAIPFGWAGSGLKVSDGIFVALISNLLNSIREDGFSRVYVLAPQSAFKDGTIGAGLGSSLLFLAHPSQWKPLPPIPEDGDQEKVILLSAGHTEQHALHLPLNTDTLIIDAITKGTAAADPRRAAALPVFPYGVSTHRSSFAGTLNCGGRAFEDFWLAVIERLHARGFRRMYLLSGHGGNCSFFTNIVKYAGERFRDAFIATTWLYLSGTKGLEALQAKRQSAMGGMGHACELETSLVLHLKPELVHMDRARDDIDFISTPSYYMDWVEGGSLIANPPWEDDSKHGAYGAGSLGTPEKGAFWLKAAISEKCDHVSEIHEQYERRQHIRTPK